MTPDERALLIRLAEMVALMLARVSAEPEAALLLGDGRELRRELNKCIRAARSDTGAP
jgi:hypothetical protein